MVARGPRYEAKIAGDLHYFTGIPCKARHVSVRMTDRGSCVECRRERERATYKDRYESKIKPRLQTKENRKKAAEKIAAIRSSWTEEQKAAHRESAKLRSRDWRKNNPGHRNALNAKYNADKKKRTPSWADTKQIVEIYNNCPKGFHVDHIIPLRARNVSGLHVHYNLQYLPAIDNMRKNNRWAQ
jgi:hypothetical protein